MEKVLFNEAAMYISRTSKLASGTVLGVTGKYPDRIALTHMNIGIVRAATVDRSEISEILFQDIAFIGLSGANGYNDGKHL